MAPVRIIARVICACRGVISSRYLDSMRASRAAAVEAADAWLAGCERQPSATDITMTADRTATTWERRGLKTLPTSDQLSVARRIAGSSYVRMSLRLNTSQAAASAAPLVRA